MVFNKLNAQVSNMLLMQYFVIWSGELQTLRCLAILQRTALRFADSPTYFFAGELLVMLPKTGYEWRIG